MTYTSPTDDSSSTDPITNPSTTNSTTAPTEHYSRCTNTSEEPRTRATRSKDSHRCITIRGCGPAFGRPETARVAAPRLVDLQKIIGGWSAC